jgi:poly(hydroxyalkanoate) depolymerase family esterase
MVLHGCRQTQRDIEYISNFNELADRHGFFVVYPFVTSYAGLRNRNCWGWWFEQEIHAGSGEVEDLWKIIEEVSDRYSVDARRIHVCGLSSGAAMTIAMLVAHGDRIASGAAVAGLPYAEQAGAVRTGFNFHPRHSALERIVSEMRSEMADRTRLPPIQIVHSLDDQTVDIQSGLNIRDSWATVLNVDTRNSLELGGGTQGSTRWHHVRYPAAGHSLVETILLEGPGHGWYGGEPGEFSYPDAPDVSAMMWRFFDKHSLSVGR